MLTNPQTSHGPDNNERYLIAVTTAPGRPPEPCVRPPEEREADFREVLADYERRKATPRQLKRALSIRKLYVLLSGDEVRQFPDPSKQVLFITMSSDYQKLYGVRGIGSGRMPGFGEMLSAAQIKAIVDYERSL